jgi:hypothetical protein
LPVVENAICIQCKHILQKNPVQKRTGFVRRCTGISLKLGFSMVGLTGIFRFLQNSYVALWYPYFPECVAATFFLMSFKQH